MHHSPGVFFLDNVEIVFTKIGFLVLCLSVLPIAATTTLF